MLRASTLFTFILGLSACASDGIDPHRGTGGGIDGKADGVQSDRATAAIAASSRDEGALSNGTTTVAYEGSPSYLVYRIDARAGDDLAITATSADGDPVLWLLDARRNLLKKNDDSWTDLKAEIHYRVSAVDNETVFVVIADAYRLPATFTLETSGISGADNGGLAAFDALDELGQFQALYGEEWDEESIDKIEPADYASLNLEPGFTRRDLRINETLAGEQRLSALGAYRAFRDESFANGGTAPDVVGIFKNGTLYAMEMSVEEANEDTEWWATRITDAYGNEIMTLGYMGY